jgi:hypothetical protein
MKTSFQHEIPSPLSTGAGDEIPGFPQWPEQLESELKFPVITIERKRMSEDGEKNIEERRDYRNCSLLHWGLF